MSRSILEQALWLESQGCSVFPLAPRKKRPHQTLLPIDPETGQHSWKEFQSRRATPDEIREWFRRDPNANLALVCGDISRVVAIDVDGAEGADWFRANMPRPTVFQFTSSKDKFHAFYQHPGNGVYIPPSVKLLADQIDVRGDGSYVVVGPSIHPSGVRYQWRELEAFCGMQGLEPLPNIKLTKSADGSYAPVRPGESVTGAKAIGETIEEGGRNDAVTSICGRMYAKGLQQDEVMLFAQAWNAAHCSPCLSEHEVSVIVKSMANTHRANNPYRLNANGVQHWIKTAQGDFTLADIYRDLAVVSAQDRNLVMQQVQELVVSGVIESSGSRAGQYRKRDSRLELIDFEQAEPEPLGLWLPCQLHRYCDVLPGNIVVVAGETNSGKTSFLFNIIGMNFNRKWRYLSSEMTPGELKGRMSKFEYSPAEWKAQVEFIQRASAYHDAIDPDGLNIVDFLEVYEDFSKVGAEIKKIFDRLRNGIAIIALQKKRGEEYGRGGEFTLEKARLGISLFTHGRLPDGIIGSCKITKCKHFHNGNPEGRESFYHLQQGYYYHAGPLPIEGWSGRLTYRTEKERGALISKIGDYCKAVSDEFYAKQDVPEDFYA